MPTYTGSSMVGVCRTAAVIIAVAIQASSATTTGANHHRRCRCNQPGGPAPPVLGNRLAEVDNSRSFRAGNAVRHYGTARPVRRAGAGVAADRSACRRSSAR
ncbi:hypothetical protein GCM10010185_46770 [Saccharothrix coeruleofusca]|uniref:Uncharacterized protein n=1 Tax=Saccharothrix coeruleofusca TaxID=33919 RepID=A0A918AT98_9PSEU|nr:hypothetical protein GCM10010185_46770 [Saccharothrix coeruleofusca]